VPVGGHLNGTLTLTGVQTSLRLSPPFGVLCVEDGLKEEGELSSETASSSCPALLAPSRLFYDWIQSPRLHPYFCEKMNPSLFSLRPRKKQVNS
jgi:hypothetical protein